MDLAFKYWASCFLNLLSIHIYDFMSHHNYYLLSFHWKETETPTFYSNQFPPEFDSVKRLMETDECENNGILKNILETISRLSRHKRK